MSPTLGHQLCDPPHEPHTSLSSIDQETHRGRGRILRWVPLCIYIFISCGACACAHASALVLKDSGPHLALIHTVGPVITLANKSSSLTTLSRKQMHCDQSEWRRPQLRVWTYLASVSKELQPFKPLLHTLQQSTMGLDWIQSIWSHVVHIVWTRPVRDTMKWASLNDKKMTMEEATEITLIHLIRAWKSISRGESEEGRD